MIKIKRAKPRNPKPRFELIMKLCDFEEMAKKLPEAERKKWQLMHRFQFRPNKRRKKENHE